MRRRRPPRARTRRPRSCSSRPESSLPCAGENARRPVLDGAVVGKCEQAHVCHLQCGSGRVQPGRPAREELVVAARRAVVHEHPVVGVEQPLGDREAHVAEADQRYRSSHPPSTSRLTPFTPPFSSRKIDASTTSSIVTSLPNGVRPRVASSVCSLSAQYGLSPTIPGWIPLTRIGASSTASVCTIPVTPPFTVVTVVEPG